ncbi:hypothetical protein ACN9M0_12390 [Streptomyces sp. R-07]|uniref:hypothetical protein n=1 Tax=unclassified Streptomyces TaxID=2593676 RepID=UPI003425F7EE
MRAHGRRHGGLRAAHLAPLRVPVRLRLPVRPLRLPVRLRLRRVRLMRRPVRLWL